MKRISKVIPWILAFALLIFCFAAVLPSQANADSDPSRYPTVFVHGLYGFGSYDKINDILPYWGSHTGSVIKELTGEGHPCYAASVGPFSSTWDRACELYAQITGTRTDYGIAHSQRCGHERYGRDFTGKGLIPNLNWDSAHPINLIGHSFGGVTIRMFVDLLYDGASEEVEASRAAGETVSPLFTGGHNGWIHSVTTVSSPHNGSTFIDANPLSTIVGPRFFFYAFHGVNTALPGMLDPMLDQFGLYKGDNESAVSMVSRILSSDFYSHDDNAVNDMRIPHAMALNAQMELRSDIYYFSIYGQTTITTGGITVPQPDVEPYLLPFCLTMTQYRGNSGTTWVEGTGSLKRSGTVPSFALDETWHPNDGMVNVVSGRYPFHFEGNSKVEDPHTDYTAGSSVSPGIWNVFPVENLDHIDIVGGIISHIPRVHDLYHSIMDAIASTKPGKSTPAPAPAPSRHEGCPSANMTDVPEGAWFHTFVDYVLEHGLMSGTSATTFSPDNTVTRAMVVQTLYAMDGKPATGASAPFTDVSSGQYYAAAVAWAHSHGVVSGYDDGTFRPNTPITRQQLVTILYAYAVYRNADTSPRASMDGFADAAQVENYAAVPTQWALASGLIQGRSTDTGTRICPNDTAMRSELAVMLKNLREKIL